MTKKLGPTFTAFLTVFSDFFFQVSLNQFENFLEQNSIETAICCGYISTQRLYNTGWSCVKKVINERDFNY